jgi:hypothetical protein
MRHVVAHLARITRPMAVFRSTMLNLQLQDAFAARTYICPHVAAWGQNSGGTKRQPHLHQRRPTHSRRQTSYNSSQSNKSFLANNSTRARGPARALHTPATSTHLRSGAYAHMPQRQRRSHMTAQRCMNSGGDGRSACLQLQAVFEDNPHSSLHAPHSLPFAMPMTLLHVGVVPASAGGGAAGALQQEAEPHTASHGQLQAHGQQVRRGGGGGGAYCCRAFRRLRSLG